MKNSILEIKNLNVQVQETSIIEGLNLHIKAGEIHAIMGTNGSGKSTLSKAIAGHPSYTVQGEMSFTGTLHGKVNLSELTPHERSLEGIFLGFQYPIEIPGITNATFLRETFNQHCQAQGAEELDPYDFNQLLKEKLKIVNLPNSFMKRAINEGLSGGEKKKNEILQMLLLNPELAILDETDSGLDIDALKVVAEGINLFKSSKNGGDSKAIILITHYQRLLEYVVPDFVHVMHKGKILKTGDRSLALELEADGYDKIIAESLEKK
jgi:Fe-S cluster assembly ATP-binding protein